MNVIEHPDVEKVFVSKVSMSQFGKKKIILAILKTNRTFVEVTWQTVCTGLYQFG